MKSIKYSVPKTKKDLLRKNTLKNKVISTKAGNRDSQMIFCLLIQSTPPKINAAPRNPQMPKPYNAPVNSGFPADVK